MDLKTMKRTVERLQGERDLCRKQIRQTRAVIKEKKNEIDTVTAARVLAQRIAKETQSKLEYRVSELSTLALQAVMEDEMRVVLDFDEKRGKTEANLYVETPNGCIPPKDNVGGGVVDILGMTLRFALWTLMRPRTRPIFVLDEPLKWLKGKEMPYKGMAVISEISRKLGAQVIMVSHSPELIAGADKVIEI